MVPPKFNIGKNLHNQIHLIVPVIQRTQSAQNKPISSRLQKNAGTLALRNDLRQTTKKMYPLDYKKGHACYTHGLFMANRLPKN